MTSLPSLPNGYTFNPGAFAPLEQRLLRALADIQEQLEHPEPHEPDGLYSLYTPAHLELALLTGHLTLLGLQLVWRGHTAYLALTTDMARTFYQQHPAGKEALDVLESLSTVMQIPTAVALSAEEVHHVGALLLDEAARVGLSLAAALREGGLAWAAFTRPPNVRNPAQPSLAELRPLATRVPARQHREAGLVGLLDQVTSIHEAYAALLLLYVNARDTQANFPVITVLAQAAIHLTVARDLHTDDRTDMAVVLALREHMNALHSELGRPRVLSIQRPWPVPRAKREQVERIGLVMLRDLRSGRVRADDTLLLGSLKERFLWVMFDHLDHALAAGETPENDPTLRTALILNSVFALTRTHRAPGQALPPIVELAAELSGIDPLWAWQETQPNEQGDQPVHNALAQVTGLIAAGGQYRPEMGEALGWEINRVMRGWFGHLLAVLRRQGVRLPEQALIEDTLRPIGMWRGSAFTAAEEEQYLAAVKDIAQALLHAQAAWGEDDEEALPAGEIEPATVELEAVPEGECPAASMPEHVIQARALLSGKRVTLLGGVPRPAHHAALMRDLDLAELDWVPSEAYQHGTHAAAHVPEDTAVVILAVRWMGHAHNTLRDVARERGVPYVLHPGGLNPSSVAYQVLRQVSEQLQAG